MQPADLEQEPVGDIDLVYQELLEYCQGDEELATKLYHDGPETLKQVKCEVKRKKR